MSEFRESQKMNVVQLHEWTPKQFLHPSLNPKIAHQRPIKSKMTPKLSQNQMSEVEETQRIKVVQLYEWTPKQFLNPILNNKNGPLGARKSKNDPKIMSKLKEAKKTKVVPQYKLIPKQFEPDPDPQNSLILPPKKPKKRSLNYMKSKARIEGDI